MALSYRFSAFLSYKRDADPDADVWHEWSANKIASYLRTNAGLPAATDVFVDRNNIPDGSYWRDRLQKALHHSPILIAFVSRAYFQSPYCMAELKTFMDREDKKMYPRGTLIHMAAIAEPSTFGADAQGFQVEKFHKYYSPSVSFSETRLASEYSAAIRGFTSPISNKLINPDFPPHSDDFPLCDLPGSDAPPPGHAMFSPQGSISQPFSGAL